MCISEDFLYFIWRFRLYNAQALLSNEQQRIEVVHPGIFNTNAGPDFNCAKIRIQGILWIGQVEIHVKASDWMRHHHDRDGGYENVILHVVYENDCPVVRKNGTVLPVLEMKGLFDARLLSNYGQLLKSFNHFPCEKQIGCIDQSYMYSFLSRILIERLEEKAVEVERLLLLTRNDWDETFYILLARNFGFKVNALPFELLACSLSHRILAKYKDKPMFIEALIFGQAGFLNQEFSEAYPSALKVEYDFLCRKHDLKCIDVSLWKFLRMRPQNFPTLRLAQFAAILSKSSCLFSKVLALKDIKSAFALFEDLPVNPYWKKHYHFNSKADEVLIQLGKMSIYNIVINTICQLFYVYGRHLGEEEYVERAISFLESLSAEKNAVINCYVACGLKIDTAYLSQAILQLNKNYCVQKKCLNCSIGMKVINK